MGVERKRLKIHPTKLGMRSWMFFGGLEAGENNELIYTVLANYRAQGLDSEDYLTEALRCCLPRKPTPELMPPERVFPAWPCCLPHKPTPELIAARITAERQTHKEKSERKTARSVKTASGTGPGRIWDAHDYFHFLDTPCGTGAGSVGKALIPSTLKRLIHSSTVFLSTLQKSATSAQPMPLPMAQSYRIRSAPA